MMKKRILLCMLAVLLVILTATQVFAAGSVSISLSSNKTSVNSGDRFTVTVYATVDSCGSGGIDVSYNTAVFREVESKCVLSGTALSGSDVFAFESSTPISGNAFQITFEVKSGAALGSSGITVKFKADSKTASKTINVTVACAHTYSNSCDTSCNSCGATRSITHSWNSGTVTKKATCTATGTKKYTCTVCGTTTTDTISKAAHSYSNSCDATCNSCGASRSVSHTYKWKCDTTSHWQECSGCSEKKEQGSHSLGAEMSGNEAGHGHLCSVCGLLPDKESHSYENDCDSDCAKCGYVRTVTHSYSERLSFDPGGHWYACTICGDKLEKSVHTPGEPATQTTDQICTACGFVIEMAGNHVHKMAGDYLSDDKGHWFLCGCGSYTHPEAHKWDDGSLNEQESTVNYRCTVCGHNKKELYISPATEETVSDAEQQFPWVDVSFKEQQIPDLYIYIGLGVVATSFVANIVLIICLCAKGKRKKNKIDNENTET